MQIDNEVSASWGCIALPLWVSDVLRLGIQIAALRQTVRHSRDAVLFACVDPNRPQIDALQVPGRAACTV